MCTGTDENIINPSMHYNYWRKNSFVFYTFSMDIIKVRSIHF